MWASDKDDYTLEGFVYHNYPRKCKQPKSKRGGGGGGGGGGGLNQDKL